jgi:hypothetical protein
MGTLIFLILCTAGEGFLLFALVSFTREARKLTRESARAHLMTETALRAPSRPIELPAARPVHRTAGLFAARQHANPARVDRLASIGRAHRA